MPSFATLYIAAQTATHRAWHQAGNTETQPDESEILDTQEAELYAGNASAINLDRTHLASVGTWHKTSGMQAANAAGCPCSEQKRYRTGMHVEEDATEGRKIDAICTLRSISHA